MSIDAPGPSANRTGRSMTEAEISRTVSTFISKNFLFDEHLQVTDDQSLLGTSVLDSTGVLELITFLETEYGVKFNDDELTAENFDSLAIRSIISRKLNN
jgi:acyl carrier protein